MNVNNILITKTFPLTNRTVVTFSAFYCYYSSVLVVSKGGWIVHYTIIIIWSHQCTILAYFVILLVFLNKAHWQVIVAYNFFDFIPMNCYVIPSIRASMLMYKSWNRNLIDILKLACKMASRKNYRYQELLIRYTNPVCACTHVAISPRTHRSWDPSNLQHVWSVVRVSCQHETDNPSSGY